MVTELVRADENYLALEGNRATGITFSCRTFGIYLPIYIQSIVLPALKSLKNRNKNKIQVFTFFEFTLTYFYTVTLCPE